MVNESTQFPLDFSALAKGDVISEDQIRDIYNTKTDQDHRLAAMSLREDIELARSDLYPVCKGRTIAILTDAEAHEHSVHRHGQLVQQMERTAKRRARIDASDMSEAERRLVEHWDQRMAAQAIQNRHALRQARQEALMLPAPKKERE